MRIVVLLSGAGTLLQALLDADQPVVAVGADRSTAPGLARAADRGIATFVCPYRAGASRSQWDADLTAQVTRYEPDLVVSAGFLKLVGSQFLGQFGGRMINSHPSLLPSFPGMYAVRDALAAGVKVTGATVFMVDAGVDTGPILAQEPVRVLPSDTADILHERIKIVERAMLVRTVREFAKTPADEREVRDS